MKLRVILTGATGMVGEGVLLECLQNPAVAYVLVLSRRPSGRSHPKMTELLHANLQDLGPIESQLTGYDACFFCAGISSIGVSKEEYGRITHDLTLDFARTLARLNPAMTFIYVSGAGTDGTGQSGQHWARVKGRTENELLALPFRRAYMFRPGFMQATPGQRNVPKSYRYIAWLYPLARLLAPAYVSTMQEVGRAMINAASAGAPKPVLEVPDIVALAQNPARS
ncbi:NAD-dependent epimerase/dehydratase family protein [Hymenobacter nivis]|uniref:Epimerase n=1 Tax=Hymenobacter nivis TaxID=1850093 RepID=A0A2Z3H258_9BACT|nr:NAD-dependent epimerase/dehydratase family protein [Hymenobacter nivis]AWM35090.1 epimerase [Hymenobacter nivis]